jgi:hypothetical protein
MLMPESQNHNQREKSARRPVVGNRESHQSLRVPGFTFVSLPMRLASGTASIPSFLTFPLWFL